LEGSVNAPLYLNSRVTFNESPLQYSFLSNLMSTEQFTGTVVVVTGIVVVIGTVVDVVVVTGVVVVVVTAPQSIIHNSYSSSATS